MKRGVDRDRRKIIFGVGEIDTLQGGPMNFDVSTGKGHRRREAFNGTLSAETNLDLTSSGRDSVEGSRDVWLGYRNEKNRGMRRRGRFEAELRRRELSCDNE